MSSIIKKLKKITKKESSLEEAIKEFQFITEFCQS